MSNKHEKVLALISNQGKALREPEDVILYCLAFKSNNLIRPSIRDDVDQW